MFEFHDEGGMFTRGVELTERRGVVPILAPVGVALMWVATTGQPTFEWTPRGSSSISMSSSWS